MSDHQTINVTGVREGTVGTANTAGIVHGGMGNLTHNKGAKNTAYNSNVGQMGDGGTATGTTFGVSTPPLATDSYANHGGQCGQFGRGGMSVGTTFGSTSSAPTKDHKFLSSANLLEEVGKAEVTDETRKIFAENRITGAMFLDDKWEDTLKSVGITTAMDMVKLRILREDLKGIQKNSV